MAQRPKPDAKRLDVAANARAHHSARRRRVPLEEAGLHEASDDGRSRRARGRRRLGRRQQPRGSLQLVQRVPTQGARRQSEAGT